MGSQDPFIANVNVIDEQRYAGRAELVNCVIRYGIEMKTDGLPRWSRSELADGSMNWSSEIMLLLYITNRAQGIKM